MCSISSRSMFVYWTGRKSCSFTGSVTNSLFEVVVWQFWCSLLWSLWVIVLPPLCSVCVPLCHQHLLSVHFYSQSLLFSPHTCFLFPFISAAATFLISPAFLVHLSLTSRQLSTIDFHTTSGPFSCPLCFSLCDSPWEGFCKVSLQHFVFCLNSFYYLLSS